jgi:hypothetical protein
VDGVRMSAWAEYWRRYSQWYWAMEYARFDDKMERARYSSDTGQSSRHPSGIGTSGVKISLPGASSS